MPPQKQPTPNPLYQEYLRRYPASLGVEAVVARTLGVDPEIFKYASRRASQFGFEDEAHRGHPGWAPGNKGYQSAIRHMLLAGELERTHPRLAGPLLWGHEYITGIAQEPVMREMDLINNALGRELGRRAKSREELELLTLINLPRAATVETFGLKGGRYPR